MNIHKKCQRLLVLLSIALATGCSIHQTNDSGALLADARWALLPIVNLSQAPLAGERTEAILATRLRALEIATLVEYPTTANQPLVGLHNDQKRLEEAKRWVQTQDVNYWITGTIEEWRYKAGLDGEPAVGISLRVIDANDGSIVWSGSGARTGWGREGVSITVHEVLEDLLGNIPFGTHD